MSSSRMETKAYFIRNNSSCMRARFGRERCLLLVRAVYYCWDLHESFLSVSLFPIAVNDRVKRPPNALLVINSVILTAVVLSTGGIFVIMIPLRSFEYIFERRKTGGDGNHSNRLLPSDLFRRAPETQVVLPSRTHLASSPLTFSKAQSAQPLSHQRGPLYPPAKFEGKGINRNRFFFSFFYLSLSVYFLWFACLYK